MAPLMNLVRLRGFPILQQLHLEECMLRTSSSNWCIINDRTTSPTVIMGLSGKVLELVEAKSVLRDHIPVIRRFTGGGTLIVDQGTIFVTLICNKDDVSDVQPFPRPIMLWSGQLYDEVFKGLADFHLRENVNRTGQLTGYKLVPGSNCLPLARPEAKFLRRAAFFKHNLWVTPYAHNGMHPEGEFPNQNPRVKEGLVTWVQPLQKKIKMHV